MNVDFRMLGGRLELGRVVEKSPENANRSLLRRVNGVTPLL